MNVLALFDQTVYSGIGVEMFFSGTAKPQNTTAKVYGIFRRSLMYLDRINYLFSVPRFPISHSPFSPIPISCLQNPLHSVLLGC